MRFGRVGWMAGCAAVLLAVASMSPGAEKQAKVKLGSLVPKGTSFHKILQAMGEQWKQAPGGGAALTLYTDGTMGGEADMVRRMRVGQLQAAMITTVGLAEIDPAVSALQSIPMAFRSLEELDYVIAKLRPELEKRLLAKGFVVLFWTDGGWVHFFSKQAAVTPADFKKTKMFAWAGDTEVVQMMKEMGYNPVPLEPTDILTGLNTGLIDAVPSTPFYALAGQFYGPAPHMLKLNWAPLVGATVITRKAWDTMSKETQDALLKAAEEAGAQIKDRSRAEALESIEAMKKRGLIIHEPSPEIQADWARLAEATYPKMRGKLIPAEIFDSVMEHLKKYRAKGTS